MMGNELIDLGVIAAVAAFGLLITELLDRRQLPLDRFNKQDMELAFRMAPEKRAVVVVRGSMSRKEFRELHKRNLARIDAEMARRQRWAANVSVGGHARAARQLLRTKSVR